MNNKNGTQSFFVRAENVVIAIMVVLLIVVLLFSMFRGSPSLSPVGRGGGQIGGIGSGTLATCGGNGVIQPVTGSADERVNLNPYNEPPVSNQAACDSLVEVYRGSNAYLYDEKLKIEGLAATDCNSKLSTASTLLGQTNTCPEPIGGCGCLPSVETTGCNGPASTSVLAELVGGTCYAHVFSGVPATATFKCSKSC